MLMATTRLFSKSQDTQHRIKLATQRKRGSVTKDLLSNSTLSTDDVFFSVLFLASLISSQPPKQCGVVTQCPGRSVLLPSGGDKRPAGFVDTHWDR